MPRRKPESKPREGGRAKRDIVIKKDCKICEEDVILDYKQPDLLKKFMTERGKILPRRITGNCAYHQRVLGRSIKRARVMMMVR